METKTRSQPLQSDQLNSYQETAGKQDFATDKHAELRVPDVGGGSVGL